MAQKDKKYEAKRATIHLGDIPLEVFWVMELSQYRLSQTQVLEAITVPTNWISRLQKDFKKAVEYLQRKGFTGIQLEVFFKEKGNRGTKSAKTISITDATLIWGWFSRPPQSNELAADIMEACVAEAMPSAATLRTTGRCSIWHTTCRGRPPRVYEGTDWW